MEAIVSDLISRYLRSMGKKVIFISGTDDNSFKLTFKARQNNEDPQSFVDRFAKEFLMLKDTLSLSYDLFYRTSSHDHGSYVNNYINGIDKKYIEQKNFKSYFCQDCEAFIGINIQEPKICPFHNTRYVLVDENNYFLKVSEFKDMILSNMKTKIILPESSRKESIFLCEKFYDFNFTRENLYKWGIVFKADPRYIFYSFFDALLGYIGAISSYNIKLNYEVCLIQNIGRDILKFHSVYFPFLLFISGIKYTPDYLLVHVFVNMNGEKMSKSKGNVISIADLLNKYHKNIVRLYLTSRDIFLDFEFSLDELIKIEIIYKKYLKCFNVGVIGFNSDKQNKFFHENMLKFRFMSNFEKFRNIINSNESFESLLIDDKIFLKEFSFIFIPQNI